jgi:hypothetical protein
MGASSPPISGRKNFLTMASELLNVLSPLLSFEEQTIWITKNSYVRLHYGEDEYDEYDDRTVVCDQHEKQFLLQLGDETHLSIHASTLEESITCLDYLVGLQDTHFGKMELTYKDDDETRLCPFGVNILEKMLQNSARGICFIQMIFTSDHCHILASSGTNTSIEFYWCVFQDEGVAFVEASAARQDETSGPAKLHFEGHNPFNDRNWALFLSQHKLEYLRLNMIHLESQASCSAVATAEVQCLTLVFCALEDEGAALIEAIRQGRGPKELFFLQSPFRSSESLVTFINALRYNTNLERLGLPGIEDRQVTQALAAALHENKGLVHLAAYFSALDDSDWTNLLKAISLHPSLRSLDLRCPTSDAKERQNFTKAVADMLSVNERVEEVSYHYHSFDNDDWDAFVVPRLECNVYRKRFPSIHKIGEASTRAAVLARALEMFASKPHLVWMLLNQNLDILSSYPSRKRSRSSSLDGTSAH